MLAVADEIVRWLKKLPCPTAYLVIKKNKKNHWLTSSENLSLKFAEKPRQPPECFGRTESLLKPRAFRMRPKERSEMSTLKRLLIWVFRTRQRQRTTPSFEGSGFGFGSTAGLASPCRKGQH